MSTQQNQDRTIWDRRLVLWCAVASLGFAPFAQASLIGQWNFNEEAGTIAYDASGNGNNGTNTGASYVQVTNLVNNIGPTSGDYALKFDGTSGVVNMGTPSSFNISGTSAKLSLAAWLQITAFPASGETVIAGKFVHGNYYYGLTVYQDKRMYAYAPNGNTLSSLITTGAWHFVVLTLDNSAPGPNEYLYIDNAVAGSLTTSTTISGNSTVPFVVGFNSAVGTPHFNGLIDQIQLYNSALTPSDVASLFAAGPVPEPSTLTLLAVALTGLWWRKNHLT